MSSFNVLIDGDEGDNAVTISGGIMGNAQYADLIAEASSKVAAGNA
jgi:hypothetical protein